MISHYLITDSTSKTTLIIEVGDAIDKLEMKLNNRFPRSCSELGAKVKRSNPKSKHKFETRTTYFWKNKRTERKIISFETEKGHNNGKIEPKMKQKV